jgi:enamine deaminase RidA (YjgF/YER057c/UK114 family)
LWDDGLGSGWPGGVEWHIVLVNRRGTHTVNERVIMAAKEGLGTVDQGGARMLWGIGAKAGGFVFLSGVTGRSDDEDIPVTGIKAQTYLALDRIDQRLKDAGTSFANSVKFIWYVQGREHKDAFLYYRDAWLKEHYPHMLDSRDYAATLLMVGLDRLDMFLEIDCIAYVPES